MRVGCFESIEKEGIIQGFRGEIEWDHLGAIFCQIDDGIEERLVFRGRAFNKLVESFE